MDLNFLEGTIKSFEEKMAVVSFEDGQELRWPIKKLPVSISAGDKIKIFLKTSASEPAEGEQTAKDILNEIFNNSNGAKNK